MNIGTLIYVGAMAQAVSALPSPQILPPAATQSTNPMLSLAQEGTPLSRTLQLLPKCVVSGSEDAVQRPSFHPSPHVHLDAVNGKYLAPRFIAQERHGEASWAKLHSPDDTVYD